MAKVRVAAGERERGARGQPAHLVETNTKNTIEINSALAHVLDAMEADRSIPATQEELARRANCSRGAIAYRDDIRQRLKKIKARRKSEIHRSSEPGSIEDLAKKIREAQEQLKAARAETKRQFDKRLEVERERDRYRKLYAVQAKVAAELREKLALLGGRSGEVVHFPGNPE